MKIRLEQIKMELIYAKTQYIFIQDIKDNLPKGIKYKEFQFI